LSTFARASSTRGELLVEARQKLLSPKGEEVLDAIKTLGALGGAEEVDLLARRIDYLASDLSPRICRFECETETAFEAAVALAAIGAPSVRATEEILSKDEDAKKRRLALWVLVNVLGKEVAECAVETWVAAAQVKNSGTQRKQLLERALTDVRSYQPLWAPVGGPGSGPWEQTGWYEP
jgi:hypothetical protein